MTEFELLALGTGPWEILAVLFVILLLFGSKKLPSLARSLGQSLNEFKRGKAEVEKELAAGEQDAEQLAEHTERARQAAEEQR